MARIMYWNVNNFGNERFFTQQYRKVKRRRLGQGGLSDVNAAASRLDFLVNTILQNPPDILVIVEVNTGTNGLPEGELVDEKSSYDLLETIRNTTGNQSWCLIPPIISGTGGRAEGIAVIYNSTNLYFTGPWRWPGAFGPADSPAVLPTLPLGFYPEPYTFLTNLGPAGPGNPYNPANINNALPNRTIPVGSTYNAGFPEYQLAGQWNFHAGGDPNNAQLQFPAAGNRRPFLTTFHDVSNPMVPRTIRLLSFHASPIQVTYDATIPGYVPGPAATGTAQIANIHEMNQAPGANEVNVIAGDFNIPLWNIAGAVPSLPTAAYTPITNLGYVQQLQQVPNQYPDKSYRITHLRPPRESDPYNTNGFPGFGYLTEAKNPPPQRYDAIDNIFVWYPGGAGPATNMTIVNRVAGSPYEGGVCPGLPGGVPAGTGGTLAYTQYLNNAACLPRPNGINNPPPPVDKGRKKSFQGWQNFKRIRSASDHMALILDI